MELALKNGAKAALQKMPPSGHIIEKHLNRHCERETGLRRAKTSDDPCSESRALTVHPLLASAIAQTRQSSFNICYQGQGQTDPILPSVRTILSVVLVGLDTLCFISDNS